MPPHKQPRKHVIKSQIFAVATTIQLAHTIRQKRIADVHDVEEQFLHAADAGDMTTVKRLIQDNPTLDVDCVDTLRRTALRLAVRNEHLEVVELLLDRSSMSHIYEAALQAIGAGHVAIAEVILKHRRYLEFWKERKKMGDDDHFYKTTYEESEFSPDITPLMLSSYKNQYEIVQLLLLRGERIQKPHKFTCACLECSNKLTFDQLRFAKCRLNAYRGIASEAYISLSSTDPILTAFELADELRSLSRAEKYFMKDYRDLADQLSDYVVKLLSRVRTQTELQTVLDKKGSDVDKYTNLARLQLAILYGEKKFVSYPSCQQHLMATWYRGIKCLDRCGWIKFMCVCMAFCALYPFLVPFYLLFPSSKPARILQYPCVKFICHSASFTLFLVLLAVSSAQPLQTLSSHRNLSSLSEEAFDTYKDMRNGSNETLYGEDFPVRQTKPTAIQFVLFVWTVGFACQTCNQLMHNRIRDYLKFWYNPLHIAAVLLYFTSFTLQAVSMHKVSRGLTYLAAYTEPDTEKARYWLYWLNTDRFYWNTYDPVHVAEGLFAIATILSFARISCVFPAIESLGPLQISLGRMVKDILKFLALGGFIFCAFMIGLHNLYGYYSMRHTIEVTSHSELQHVSAEEGFGSVRKTFQTVFWSMLGLGEPKVVELDGFNNTFTEDIGYIIYGAYNVTVVVVLINMLIAMMARSYQIIAEESEKEWKFARSLLFMRYIRKSSVLPVPLNMLGFLRAVILVCTRICCGKKGKSPDETTLQSTELASRDSKEVENGSQFVSNPNTETLTESNDLPETAERTSYQEVMQAIKQRYIFDIQREEEVTEEDFNDIRQDLSSFRSEMAQEMCDIQKQLYLLNITLGKPLPSISIPSDNTIKNGEEITIEEGQN